MKAIILAGEGNRDIEYFGRGKALVSFREEPMIEYTINALIDSEMIDYILVVGNENALTPIIGDSVDRIIGQENNILDNLIKSISYFSNEENVVIATCDIPLITSDAIRYLINNALNLG